MTIRSNTLLTKQCSSSAPRLDADAIAALLPQVPGWSVQDGKLVRNFPLCNYHQVIEFVNALAWMTHAQDHHPELLLTYKDCAVSYSTHSAAGLSENDFICAARASAIHEQRQQRAGA